MPVQQFTPKQQRFIEFYDGNGTEAARKAGYVGSAKVLGITAARLLGNARVLEAVQRRERKEIRPKIAARLDRQEFWTKVMLDPAQDMRERLRASELLGRSEADFTEKVQMNSTFDLAERLKEARLRVAAAKARLPNNGTS
jgi:phage terminase small subunit